MRATIRKALAKLRNLLDLRDGFAFGGLACVAYGVAQIHQPAAWIVTGIALFWLGIKR